MSKEEKIKKGMPAKRPIMSLQTQHAILIPAGTILRQEPEKPGVFTCPVAKGVFSVETLDALAAPETYKRVVTA